jgi:hypothetical protein
MMTLLIHGRCGNQSIKFITRHWSDSLKPELCCPDCEDRKRQSTGQEIKRGKKDMRVCPTEATVSSVNAGSSRCWCCGAPQSEEYDHSHARLHRNRKILGEYFRETVGGPPAPRGQTMILEALWR